ncbi:RINT-1 family protein [Coccidioides immitis RMSCC 2394]|uniref:RINT-1 family protein n=1 Tax=Coccidioides immitis RMSCC 2394 TaxID=404692 RepID=A0A0J6YK67_COCIT|nr:RINT-1 family protein [Coccidioides immitis RMSCC 2394]
MARRVTPGRRSTTPSMTEYLNENIQTVADLQSLDSLLESLQKQQELQKQQLREAEEILSKATEASKQHTETVRRRAEAFNEQQNDIDRRLVEVTQSKSSDEATRKFEASMEKLGRLEIAKGYMELLGRVNRISEDTLSVIQRSPNDALSLYSEVAAEGAAPHLIDYTTKLVGSLKDALQKEYSGKLRAVLEKMKWPSKELQVDDALVRQWADWFELLLRLQEPKFMNCRDVIPQIELLQNEAQYQETPALLPLEEMMSPLNLRFRYHFSGDKPTNRLDKPEYFLSHIIDLINTYSDFFMTYLQPILNRRAQDCDSRLIPFYSNAIFSYITALLPMARHKINSTLPHIANHSQLLSHFIHELMQFDNDVREIWGYSPAFKEDRGWKGLTWEVLVKQDWFAQWLQVEKDFALSRYQDIIDAPDSGEIDYDGVEATATKPTKAAIRVNDLLETITDRYRPLSSFSQKLRFLIDIQITIFDLFHERLHSGLEAYLAMKSTIGRTMQGSSASQVSLEGIAGLERLCRIFGSAEYLEKKMQDWSDDVFFLELWYELQDRVDQNARSGRPVAGSMSISDVAARTSSSITDSNADHGAGGIEGALFDETSSAYRRIRIRSESIIVSTLTSTARATQLRIDFEHICTTLDAALGVPAGKIEAKKIAQKLAEGLLLLELNIKPKDSVPEAEETDKRNGDGTHPNLGLWEVEKGLFASNESAREVLKSLGIEVLTEAQARAILERRVELRG